MQLPEDPKSSLEKIFGSDVEDSGADLATFVADELYQHLVNYEMIVLRNQPDFSPAAHLRLAQTLGAVEPGPQHPVYPSVTSEPDPGTGETKTFHEIVTLQNGPDHPPDTDTWHTDMTFKQKPPFCSVLYSKLTPPVGGDTLWASLAAAYESLSEGMRRDLSCLEAVHEMGSFRNNFAAGGGDGIVDAHRQFGSAVHPVVQTLYGKKFLYVNPGFTSHVVGMTSTESQNLLKFLFDHCAKPEFQCRVRWDTGVVVLWDNRCTMHYAVNDYWQSAERVMHRVVVGEDRRAG